MIERSRNYCPWLLLLQCLARSSRSAIGFLDGIMRLVDRSANVCVTLGLAVYAFLRHAIDNLEFSILVTSPYQDDVYPRQRLLQHTKAERYVCA
jgi:hypothetical protein